MLYENTEKVKREEKFRVNKYIKITQYYKPLTNRIGDVNPTRCGSVQAGSAGQIPKNHRSQAKK